MLITPKNAEILFRSLEEVATAIGLHVNFKKTVLMNFNQAGVVRTINNVPLEEVDGFTYLGIEIASTVKDINIRLGKGRRLINLHAYGNRH